MKQKLIIFALLLSTFVAAFAQGIPLRFTAQYENGAYHPFDTVRIENLSRGWSYALAYPDTAIVLGDGGSSEGIEDIAGNASGRCIVHPNPFAGRTEAALQLTEGGNVNMRIIRIDGTVATSYNGTLTAGGYRIRVQLSKPQVAFLCIETEGQRYVAKLVNSVAGGADKIEVQQVASRTLQPKDTEPGDFEEGDTMRFTAIDVSHGSRTESEPVTEAVVEGGDIVMTFGTDADPVEPTVSTAAISDITTTSATCGGNVTDDGGEDVTARGVCWSTTPAPTTDDSHTTDGSGTGEFASAISNLTPATTYYVRAYATNSVGTAYGNEVTFTTEEDVVLNPPTVVTSAVSNVTTTSATCGGTVTDDDGEDVTARGVCWSTTSAPTTDDNHTTDGSGTGEFTSTISDLTPATTYYVRAYATNSVGTAYGEEVIFNTESIGGFDEVGASNAFFSVSTDRQVRFSRGNLQYQASTDTWRFAEHQYDRIWTDNLLISDTNSGWIDLFAWGTSGWNSGANEYMPWSHCKNNADYFIGGDYSINMTGIYADADWGVHNAISNGGNQSGMWRMLNADEWNYLINYRENASSKFGLVVVDSSYSGIAILPDEWIMPEGMIFRTGIQTSNTNRYTMDEWNMMENHGAIFLPMANSLGCGEMGWPVDAVGFYWSSSINTSTTTACYLNFCGGFIGFGTTNGRWLGMSVRLVRDSVPSCGHPAAIPTVTTTDASEIGTTQVICGGIVLDGGVTEVTDCGICWSTETNPSVVDSTVSNGSGTGNFEVTISNLLPGTVYYAGAYAVNGVGIAYGNEVTFTTEEDSNPIEGVFDENGASYATFSVAADRQVHFSKGNLQYRATTNTWRFAENQYDIIGIDNLSIGETYDGWIDLFGWGTSGWNSGATAYQPWASSYESCDYMPGGDYNNSLTGDYCNADWGVYNPISNGGDQQRMWRTLSKDEWFYLLADTTVRRGKYGAAKINDMCLGLVLLPDEWIIPEGLYFNSAESSGDDIYVLNNCTINNYTLSEWRRMEASGAIFLPIAGARRDSSIYMDFTDYWTSSHAYYDNAAHCSNQSYCVGVERYSSLDGQMGVELYSSMNNAGNAVRLVKTDMPTVTTNRIVETDSTTCICESAVTNDGGAELSACGVCWSTSPNPTIEDNHSSDGTQVGLFYSVIHCLSPNTTYYIRAYATNVCGTSYGEELSFNTDNGVVSGFDSHGATYAFFSVADDRHVRFSRGNLQYQASTDTWRFAENQWECIGINNTNISDSNSGWIDLFGWGTSGWNSGAVCYQPWSTSTTHSNYRPGGSASYNLTGDYANADWGVYNAIINGGNMSGLWRTLTKDEWSYLFGDNENRHDKYASAIIDDTYRGMIVLPDNWATPEGVNLVTGMEYGYYTNSLTISEWEQLEAYGAIFLPVTESRNGHVYQSGYNAGRYWSSSKGIYVEQAGCFQFYGDSFECSYANRQKGLSVRLVWD